MRAQAREVELATQARATWAPAKRAAAQTEAASCQERLAPATQEAARKEEWARRELERRAWAREAAMLAPAMLALAMLALAMLALAMRVKARLAGSWEAATGVQAREVGQRSRAESTLPAAVEAPPACSADRAQAGEPHYKRRGMALAPAGKALAAGVLAEPLAPATAVQAKRASLA